MKRPMRIFAWVTVGVALALCLALTGLGIAANFEPRLVERMVPKITGGAVVVRGLAGRFPDAFGLSHLDLRDSEGAWLEIEDLALDWSPLALLSGRVRIDNLRAARVVVRRLPGESQKSPAGGSVDLPLPIDLVLVQIDRVDVEAPLANRDSSFSMHGSLHLASQDRGRVDVEGLGLGVPGRFVLQGEFDQDKADLHLDLQEPAGGLMSGIAGLPDLGPLSILASLQGPRSMEQARIAVVAGQLKANVEGTIDLAAGTLNLDVRANAPAMAPRADMSWLSVLLTAQIQGAFHRPDASGHLDIEGLAVGAVATRSVKADLQGNAGLLHLGAQLLEVRVPGSKPDLLAAAPLTLDAEVRLDDPKMPLTFTLSHPLFECRGRVDVNDGSHGQIALTVPVLAPVAEAVGFDLQGHAELRAEMAETEGATVLTLAGTLGADGGAPPLQVLIGQDARIDIAAAWRGADLTIEHAAIDGKSLHLSVTGSDKGQTLDFAWEAVIGNLSALAANATGTLSAKGRLHGAESDPTVEADLSGDVAVGGLPRSPLSVSVRAQGLPTSPTSRISVHGVMDGAPLDLAVGTQHRVDGKIELSIEQAHWKSAEVQGGIVVDQNWQLPRGEVRLRMARLADLRTLLGTDLGGKLDGAIVMGEKAGQAQARLMMTATSLTLAGGSVGRAVIEGTIVVSSTRPKLTAQVTLSDISAGGITGALTLGATGSTDALALHLAADVSRSEIAAQLRSDATLDVSRKRLGLTMLQAQSCGETAHLLAPAHIDFAGDGILVGHLQLGVRQATLDLAGRLSPQLALSLSVRDVPPGLGSPCLSIPLPLARGAFAADLKLSGTAEAPEGSFHVTGRGLQMQGDAGRALPFADLDVTGDLRSQSMKLIGDVKAGSAFDLRLTGDVPLQPAGILDVKTSGTVDLALLGPILVAGDRTVRGHVTVNATVAGAVTAPCITGTVELTKGAVQDFSQGVEITDVAATVEAKCGLLHILSLTAKAGSGTIAAGGTIDLLSDGMPVDLSITAENARPLASDLLTANIDTDLTLRGPAAGNLILAGTIHVRRADINIPDSFASRVAVLDVRRRGQDRPPPPKAATSVSLALSLAAPEQIFVRGHGIDAEMSGQIRIDGTSLAPQVSGGFGLRRGTFSLAGKTLDFVSGQVSFDGSGVTHKIDPTLRFVAQSSSSAVTATLTIGGYADAPTITLSSVPSLPQDEVLAQLIFGQSVKQLSPLQIAQVAQAVASLTNVGGGLDPLGAVRKSLGLDRLSAGSGSSGSGASLQAGKYVANGVYVGAQQGTSGGTRAQVQIDLMDKLKLETTIGTGNSSGTTEVTPQNDPGSSVGLTYQLEY